MITNYRFEVQSNVMSDDCRLTMLHKYRDKILNTSSPRMIGTV